VPFLKNQTKINKKENQIQELWWKSKQITNQTHNYHCNNNKHKLELYQVTSIDNDFVTKLLLDESELQNLFQSNINSLELVFSFATL
jgi:acetyl-CoA carboxylase beta subunit